MVYVIGMRGGYGVVKTHWLSIAMKGVLSFEGATY